MTQFVGVWHVIQGTLTGQPVECITFNVSKSNDTHYRLTQIPQNWTSDLRIVDETISSLMDIKINASSNALFNVLATDYGKAGSGDGHMFFVSWRADVFIAFLSDNFAGFFICKNSLGETFEQAAAILSRTKRLSSELRNVVKQSLKGYGIHDNDLTVVLDCN